MNHRLFCLLIVLFCTMIGITDGSRAMQFEFEWRNPIPQGNGLNGLEFEDGATGLAVGNKGACLRTNDGGQTWVDLTQYPEFALNLYDVISVEPEVYLAVGESPGIFQSSDSGTTWEPVSNASSADLQNLEFTPGGMIYAVGDGGQVLRSSDNGVSWTVRNSTGLFRNLAQFWWNNESGYVVGEYGARQTDDGGATWEAVPDITGVNTLTDIHFTDPATGWILEHFTTWWTTDGGISWSENHPFIPIYQEEAIFYDAVHRIVITSLEGAEIWETFDDGVTWERLYDRLRTGGYSDIQKLPDETLITCSSYGDLLRSTDAGAVWENFTSGPGDADRTILETINIHASGLGFAGGRDEIILKTTDGGVIWETPAQAPDINTTFCFGFYNAQICLAGGYTPPGQSKIFRTLDAGETWTEHSLSDSYAGYPQGISSTDETTWFVVANGGIGVNYVFWSTDRGETWDLRNQGLSPSNEMECIQFINSTTGFVGGSNADNASAVWKTTDTGLNWIPLGGNGLGQGEVNDMHWFDEGTGLAACTLGIYRTENSGVSWTQVLSVRILSLDFINDQTGIAGSYFDPGVWITRDAGITWIPVDTPGEFPTQDVCAVESGFFVVSAGNSIIYFEVGCLNSGDVNDSGDITAGDAQLAFMIALGVYTPTSDEFCAADCSADEDVTAGDAQSICQVAIFGGQCADPLQDGSD